MGKIIIQVLSNYYDRTNNVYYLTYKENVNSLNEALKIIEEKRDNFSESLFDGVIRNVLQTGNMTIYIKPKEEKVKNTLVYMIADSTEYTGESKFITTYYYIE